MGKRLDAEFFLDELDAGSTVEAATTCWRSRWRWTLCPATRSRAGSAATATSGSSPTSGRSGRIPWHEATALVLCDVQWHDGRRCASPRQVTERGSSSGRRQWASRPRIGSELEFFLSREHEEAHAKHYLI